LVGNRLQLDRQPADQRVEGPRQARQRRRDRRDQLADQHVTAGQPRDRPHVVRAQQQAAEDPALELEQLHRPGGVVERFGRCRRVARDERQRRRSGQHRLDRLHPGPVSRSLGQRVLDHAEA